MALSSLIAAPASGGSRSSGSLAMAFASAAAVCAALPNSRSCASTAAASTEVAESVLLSACQAALSASTPGVRRAATAAGTSAGLFRVVSASSIPFPIVGMTARSASSARSNKASLLIVGIRVPEAAMATFRMSAMRTMPSSFASPMNVLKNSVGSSRRDGRSPGCCRPRSGRRQSSARLGSARRPSAPGSSCRLRPDPAVPTCRQSRCLGSRTRRISRCPR